MDSVRNILLTSLLYKCSVIAINVTLGAAKKRRLGVAKVKRSGLNDTEWQVISVLWSLDSATASEVTRAIQSRRPWAYSTVKTLLDRMVEKGVVLARQVGNVWEYRPAETEADLCRKEWQRFVDNAFGGSMLPALQFLASDAKLTKKQRQQLIDLLKEKDEKP